MARFTVLLHPEPEGGYSVHIPGLNVATQGETLDEAMAMAREAAEGMIEGMVEGHDIVVPELAPPIIASIEIDVPDEINAYSDTKGSAPLASRGGPQ